MKTFKNKHNAQKANIQTIKTDNHSIFNHIEASQINRFVVYEDHDYAADHKDNVRSANSNHLGNKTVNPRAVALSNTILTNNENMAIRAALAVVSVGTLIGIFQFIVN
jgi:hypothetical protein